MDKSNFLNTIAQKGYDIGFGAKKNFASFDIINKLPTWIGFISLAIGIIQIAYQDIPFNRVYVIKLIWTLRSISLRRDCCYKFINFC